MSVAAEGQAPPGGRRPPDPPEECAVFPASFGQERLWFLDRFEPGSPFYNVPAASRLTGGIDVAGLRSCLERIVERHEALRTTFAEVDGQPVQVIAPRLAVDLPVLDRRSVPAAEREAEVARLAAEEARRPFDLARGPLLRCLLARLADDDWLLLVTLHHIVSDAWSLGLFFRELSELYGSRLRGRPAALPELPIQYADFAQWQRAWLQGEVLESFLSYWRRQLAGAPAAIDLPTDRPRPAAQTFRGALIHFELPAALSGSLLALGQRQRATRFMTLLAVYLALLHRYSGQPDLVVGAPIANRNRAEVEGLIGFFVNTLALRVDLAGDPSFRELLERVAEVTLAAYDHQDLPFEKLVAELRPERNLSQNPLFQVMFSLQNAPTLAHGLGAPVQISEVGTGTAKFDLALLLGEAGGGRVIAGLEYNTDLFEPETITRLQGHFLTLLAAAAADPHRPLSQLDLMSPAERQQALTLARGAAADFPRDACLHHLVTAQAGRRPDAVAVACGGERLTYSELDARAGRLARRLRALGVGPAAPAALAVERSLALPVAVLAVLRAGSACVPLDPAYPRKRLAAMTADAGVRVVLTQRHLADRLPTPGAAVLCLDQGGRPEAGEERDLPDDATADDLAYVIFTSGSTGRPKGVAMPHRPLVNLVSWQRGASRLGPGAATLQFASLSFDVSFQEIFATWCAGGTLILLSEEGRRDPDLLLHRLVEEGIERLFLPPVALEQLARAAVCAAVPTALREVVAAGEQLQVTPEVRALFARLGEGSLHNQYGPTESHVVSAFTLAGPPEDWPALPPIGRPIANARLHLLDRELRPVPAGVPGEVCLGGVALARGYVGRPDLTAERFVPDPASGEPGARLYRTGDISRALPGGEVRFLGRLDHQVKVRGFRVELAEVESALARHPAVREAVAAVREDAPGDRRLVAYVVPGEGPAPSADRLRGFLRERLPEPMVPSAFVLLARLPLTPTGKVDRRALPPPEAVRPELEPAFVPPRTPLEEELAGIWRQVLRLDRVGVHDNFFDLGGHSLIATQVISRMRDAFGLELPLRRMFEAPTIAGLAAALVAGRAAQQRDEELAGLLAELESLSEDEVRVLLAGRQP